MELTHEELRRYSRHLLLPNVGAGGQQRLKDARVLIVGVGGLGSPAAMYLAAAGVGTIGLVDFDVVDESNLQRQILYSTHDVGLSKVFVAQKKILAINPHVNIESQASRLTSTNAMGILEDYDIVVDGTDSFPARYLINDACVLLKKPHVYGSVFRFEGQATVFDATRGPCYRCLYPEPPAPHLTQNCAEAGVLGVLPGIIGTIQATEAMKLLLQVGDPLIGRLTLFDATHMRFEEVQFQRDPVCPLCGPHRTISSLIDYDAFCGAVTPDSEYTQTKNPSDMTVQELKTRLETGENVFLLDVRTPEESKLATIGGQLLPLHLLPLRMNELDKSREIVVYCHHGARSAHAVSYLRRAGFPDVHNLSGGIDAWAREIDPGIPRY